MSHILSAKSADVWYLEDESTYLALPEVALIGVVVGLVGSELHETLDVAVDV